MSDPEFDGFIDEKTAKAGRPGRPYRFGVAAVGFLGLAIVVLPSFYSERRSTCAACRLYRTENNYLGIKWYEFEENDCSRWYAANVEASHAHAWSKCGHCQRFGFPFIYGGYACSIGGPITGLSWSFQQRVYQHSHNRLVAKRRFMRFGQWDDNCQPMWAGMFDWEKADFQGTWDEFTEKVKQTQGDQGL